MSKNYHCVIIDEGIVFTLYTLDIECKLRRTIFVVLVTNNVVFARFVNSTPQVNCILIHLEPTRWRHLLFSVFFLTLDIEWNGSWIIHCTHQVYY